MKIPHRRLATAAALLLSAASLLVPSASYAADAPAKNPNGTLASAPEGDISGQAENGAGRLKAVPRVIEIHVNDSGFDKKEYTVYTASGTSADYKDRVILHNDGQLVHSMTIVPGDPLTQKAQMAPQCFPVCTWAKFKSSRLADTGGVGGGDVFTFEMVSGGDYHFTSAPDCLNGNSTPGFDCTPFVLHVKGQQPVNLNDVTAGGTGIAAPTIPTASRPTRSSRRPLGRLSAGCRTSAGTRSWAALTKAWTAMFRWTSTTSPATASPTCSSSRAQA